MKVLEREVRELRQANNTLRNPVRHCRRGIGKFSQAELDRPFRRSSRSLTITATPVARADLPRSADRPALPIAPQKSNCRRLNPHDRKKCRWYTLVERISSKLENWRCGATRYDKTAESYLGFVALALATHGWPSLTWLRPTRHCRDSPGQTIQAANSLRTWLPLEGGGNNRS